MDWMKRIVACATATLLPVLAACGGSGSGLHFVRIDSVNSMTGWVQDHRIPQVAPFGDIAVGAEDVLHDPQDRFAGVMRFRIAPLAGKEVLTAKLVLTQKFTGGSPYATADLVMRHVDLKLALESFDYHASPLGFSYTFPPMTDGVAEIIDVTPAVHSALLAGSNVDFKLDLEPHAPPGADFVEVSLHGSNAVVNFAPHLLITYRE